MRNGRCATVPGPKTVSIWPIIRMRPRPVPFSVATILSGQVRRLGGDGPHLHAERLELGDEQARHLAAAFDVAGAGIDVHQNFERAQLLRPIGLGRRPGARRPWAPEWAVPAQSPLRRTPRPPPGGSPSSPRASLSPSFSPLHKREPRAKSTHVKTLLRRLGTLLLFVAAALCFAPTLVPPFLDRIYYRGPPSDHYRRPPFLQSGGSRRSNPARQLPLRHPLGDGTGTGEMA